MCEAKLIEQEGNIHNFTMMVGELIASLLKFSRRMRQKISKDIN
jgi:hypothetical protein